MKYYQRLCIVRIKSQLAERSVMKDAWAIYCEYKYPVKMIMREWPSVNALKEVV